MELGRIIKVHLFLGNRIIDGGQGQATQGVTASTVGADKLVDLLLSSSRHRDFVSADTDVRATLDDTFWSTLDVHASSLSSLDGGNRQTSLLRSTVRRHGFTVTAEFKSEFLLEKALNVRGAKSAEFLGVDAGLLLVEGIHLLDEADEGSLGGLTNLLVDFLAFVVVDAGIVTHGANNGNFDESIVVADANSLAVLENFTLGSVSRAGDFKLVGDGFLLVDLVEDEHLADRHLIGGQSTGLVRADDGGATKSFD